MSLQIATERLSETVFRITVTCTGEEPLSHGYATCFDKDMSCRSILLGGDLFTEGEPENSMVEMSTDGINYTKVCGAKRELRIFTNLQPNESVQFYMRIDRPNGMSLNGQKLRIFVRYGTGGEA